MIKQYVYTKQVYQALFVNNIWREWDIKQCLSSKQLFIIVRTLAKDKSVIQLCSLIIKNTGYTIRSFTNMASGKRKNEILCTLIDRLPLIPCVNYLALSNELIERQQLITSFNEFFQRFDFQSSEVQSINENELIEILTFDLTLRKNKTFHPIIWIEDYLIKLLPHHNQLMQSTLQLLLDHNNYNKTAESNPWKRLWEHNECWSLFQSFYKVQFEEWDTFIAKLQQCVVNFVEIANKLLQGFQSTEWKDKRSIIQTIETFYDEAEGQGLVLMVKLIWPDASANDENEALIVNILNQFLQNETNRLHWIELLVDPSIKSNSILSELLKKSFKDWLNKDEEEEQPFHSKVIELLCSSTFQKAKLYHSNFIEILDDRYHELRLDNDRWTDDQIKRMQDCEDKKSELFQKVIRTMEEDVPKVEELNEKNADSESKKLCLNLDYCFKYELWFKQDNPMRESLFTFLNKVLTNLTINENLLPIHVYKYLVTHLNKIKELFSHLTELVEMIQRLEEMVKEYQQFSKLIDMFKQVHNDFSIEDLPVQLKKLETESKNWEVKGFVKTRNRYDQEIKLLKEHEQSMNIMVDRRDSAIFHEIWKKHKTGHQSSKNSKLLFIFDRMFQDSNKKWEDFKQ
ncbi:hypothetical protein RFI_31387, partial [Reticulomyxa filosa]